MKELLSTQLFCVTLCFVTYYIGVWLYRVTKFELFNPLNCATVLSVLAVKWLNVPLEAIYQTNDFFSLILIGATACLGVPIYRQRKLLKANMAPILIGTMAGAAAAMVSVVLFSKALGLDDLLLRSIAPKSTTTPIAFAISDQLGGVRAITFMALFLAGLTGASLARVMIKWFHLQDEPMTAGLAIGACSHVLGTSKALEIGETEGAMSGIAIGFVGFFSVLMSLLLF